MSQKARHLTAEDADGKAGEEVKGIILCIKDVIKKQAVAVDVAVLGSLFLCVPCGEKRFSGAIVLMEPICAS